jgi:hypothetical protein
VSQFLWRSGRFFVQIEQEPATNPEIVLSQNNGGSHVALAKTESAASQFNAYLSGWAIAFTALVGTLISLSLHQYA